MTIKYSKNAEEDEYAPKRRAESWAVSDESPTRTPTRNGPQSCEAKIADTIRSHVGAVFNRDKVAAAGQATVIKAEGIARCARPYP